MISLTTMIDTTPSGFVKRWGAFLSCNNQFNTRQACCFYPTVPQNVGKDCSDVPPLASVLIRNETGGSFGYGRANLRVIDIDEVPQGLAMIFAAYDGAGWKYYLKVFNKTTFAELQSYDISSYANVCIKALKAGRISCPLI